MINIIDNVEADCQISDSNIGKQFIFITNGDKDRVFSSTLEGVGKRIEHDRRLKNNTKVLVLSDSVEACHPVAGKILVTRVLADKFMWVLTKELHPIK